MGTLRNPVLTRTLPARYSRYGTDGPIYKPVDKALARSRFCGPKGPLFAADDFVMVNGAESLS